MKGRAVGKSPRDGMNMGKWRVGGSEMWARALCDERQGSGGISGLSFLLWDLTSGTDIQGARQVRNDECDSSEQVIDYSEGRALL